jgi:hypothetical protein
VLTAAGREHRSTEAAEPESADDGQEERKPQQRRLVCPGARRSNGDAEVGFSSGGR